MPDYVYSCTLKMEVEGLECKWRRWCRIGDEAERARLGIMLCGKTNHCKYQKKVEIRDWR
jgi:hypothetical protein